eukprot:CAMPEP_0179418200 /NCGR_PEP_ID=MMETSP0799-20121207/7830_1 /TAXON_ID=46947 /ORGANISM="Geminigera cryophila, Strain CCMP2564" /LENGTH=153 /DNA_ID=CAMNT_0021191373 /DNA_START=47 /DNA_END=508 /DNA_ORIENTATION=-
MASGPTEAALRLMNILSAAGRDAPSPPSPRETARCDPGVRGHEERVPATGPRAESMRWLAKLNEVWHRERACTLERFSFALVAVAMACCNSASACIASSMASASSRGVMGIFNGVFPRSFTFRMRCFSSNMTHVLSFPSGLDQPSTVGMVPVV